MITNSYTTEQRCAATTTTNCVTYVGPDIDCLGIKSGCRLTDVECKIATTLCTLLKDVDMSTVVLPACLVTAWGTTDPTILNFIQFILDQACIQQNLLASVIDGTVTIQGLDPIITVTYPSCCQPGACNSGTTVAVSQHLTNILNCLCTVKALLGVLPTNFSTFGCAITQLNTSLTQIVNYLNGQVPFISNTINALNAQGYSLAPYNPSILTPPAGC